MKILRRFTSFFLKLTADRAAPIFRSSLKAPRGSGAGWMGEGGEGGGGSNVSCQLKFRPFVSCQLNFGPFVSCQLNDC